MADDAIVDEDMELNIDDTYEYLTGLFPNADPHYLRSSAEQFKTENDVKVFIDDTLKSNDYPTRDHYLAKMKVQRYLTNFNVKDFLSLYPDPFTHFEDETRVCEYSEIVFEFLQNEFRHVVYLTVEAMYIGCGFNMSAAAKILYHNLQEHDLAIPPRDPREIVPEYIPKMLQEMAFVRHQGALREHMNAVKRKEEHEFNSLKSSGGLLTCQCCYDDECLPSKCSTCENAHVFCNSCIVRGTDSKLGDGETHVPCFLNCGSEFSISTLQKVLPQMKFSILCSKRQAAEVIAAGLDGLVSCPFCHFASIPPEGDKVFKCLDPECMKESCIQCREPNHVPFTCGEVKRDNARKYVEEKMTQALARTCYQCKREFFKEEGCNIMTCPCGAEMCYICNNPIHIQYYVDHFSQSDTDNKCPLWSNNQLLNAAAVTKVGEDARREILQQHPSLDISTAGLPAPNEPYPDTPETHSANIVAARVLNAKP